MVTREYKTFLATSQLVSGVIRVVIVRFDDGGWHLNQWMYTLVELCSWDVAKPKLTDRSNRPWDNPDRRPSHADRRSTIAREMLGKQFLATLPRTLNLRKFRTLIKDVISLCT